MADLLGWLLRVSPQNIPPFFRADRRAPCEYSPGVNKLQIKNVKACKHPSHGSLTTPPCSGKPITQAVPAADYKKGREQLQKHLRAFPRALPECALGAEGSRKGRRADERQGRDGKRSNSDPKRTSSPFRAAIEPSQYWSGSRRWQELTAQLSLALGVRGERNQQGGCGTVLLQKDNVLLAPAPWMPYFFKKNMISEVVCQP